MNELLWFMASAFGLGVLTAVHPCPLTVHLAMFGLLGSWSQKRGRRRLLLSLFIMSYIVTVMLLAAVLGSGALAVDDLARVLRHISQRLLGPVLMLAGAFQLDLIPWRRDQFAQRWQRARSIQPGVGSAVAMGAVFALAFCPATAVMFFVLFLPLAVNSGHVLSGAAAYGLGVLTPLLMLLLLAMLGVQRLDAHEQGPRRWSRLLTRTGGVLLLLAGFYCSLRDIYGF